MEYLLQQPLPALPATLPPITGVYFTFFKPEEGDLLPVLRECLLRIAGRLGPGLYLRRSGHYDPDARRVGLTPAPLPANLWDIQSQAYLYNLARRESARVVVFDEMEQSLPWLPQRPDQSARDVVRFLHQLQRSVSAVLCIYQHDPSTPPARRKRIRQIMAGCALNNLAEVQRECEQL